MELPLTEPCPQCGADMEPRKTARRGRTIYECPDCGHQMELTETHDGQVAGQERDEDVDLDSEDEFKEDEEDDEEGVI